MKVKRKIKNSGKYHNRSGFTLIELVVAMVVFSIIMLVMVSFFSDAQKIWSGTTQRNMIYENAKIAMDLIQKDLQSAIYTTDQIPFWHWAPADYTNPPSAWGEYRFGGLAFISKTQMTPNDECGDDPCEVKYQLFYGSDNRGWLRRSVTGSKLADATDDDKYAYVSNFNVGLSSDGGEADRSNSIDDDGDGLTDEYIDAVFTANSDSSQDWHRVIPCVTKLTFTCYDDSFNPITPNTITSGNAGADAGTATDFPTMVRVQISLLDKMNWNKWVEMGGNSANAYKEDADNAGLSKSAQSPAYKLRKQFERTFTKIIFLNQ